MSQSSPKSDASDKPSSSGDAPAKAKEPRRSSSPPKDESAKKGEKGRRERAEVDKEPRQGKKKSILAGIVGRSSSWTTSLILHMAIIIILAYLYLPTPKVFDTLIAGAQGEDVSEDPVDVPEVDFDTPELEPEETELQPETDVIAEEVSESPFEEDMASAMNMEVADFGLDAVPDSMSDSTQGFDGHGLSGRGKGARAALVASGGGSSDSEEAVVRALDWLAEHQNPDGTWHLDFRGGRCQGRCKNPGKINNSIGSATALALLPYLGYGQTGHEGEYQNVVGRGLNALVRLGKVPKKGVGRSWADGGNMYGHGIAAIALCEAYGMTKDSKLKAPAQAALAYIASAQNPNDGGWRYSFQSPGDTSVVGWQVAALKSGHLAGLPVPASTIAGASNFLDLAHNGKHGDAYAYTPQKKKNYNKSLSAVGLLSRMYLGWKKEHQGIVTGATKLAKLGPSKNNFYYNYYASQVLFQYTNGKGPLWRQWNEKLRDYLVSSQNKEGHEKGSWYVDGPHAEAGGRLYMTCLATMNLEIYYRIMPIYKTGATEDEFPE